MNFLVGFIHLKTSRPVTVSCFPVFARLGCSNHGVALRKLNPRDIQINYKGVLLPRHSSVALWNQASKYPGNSGSNTYALLPTGPLLTKGHSIILAPSLPPSLPPSLARPQQPFRSGEPSGAKRSSERAPRRPVAELVT